MTAVFWAAFILAAVAMGLGAWFGRKQLLEHPIRAFSLLLVAVIVGYEMIRSWRTTEILSSPIWCRTALGAGQAAPDGNVPATDACIGLLGVQLKSVATDSHIWAGSLALSMLSLVVILLAGGKLSFSTPLGGADIGKEELARRAAVAAADKVAGAASDSAAEVKEGDGAPAPELRGPGMPEPKP